MQVNKKSPLYQAQDILSRRDHSEHELRTKMKRKRFTGAQINQAVASLKRAGLINDEKFARTYAQSVMRSKPVGPRWLAHRLKQKGIGQLIVSQITQENYPVGREAQLAQVAADTWRRTHPSHESDRQRLTRHLISRGFSYQTAEQALAGTSSTEIAGA